jgi:hypothetical protein
MVRLFIVIFAFALSSCATHSKAPIPNCPDVPEIGDQETLHDYTLHIIGLYKECQRSTQKVKK